MATSFTRMDESTQEQWLHIGAQHALNSGRVADRMLMLLESLGEITDGFNADQLTHCLQTATLAERAGADEEVVFASLMHDVGKAIESEVLERKRSTQSRKCLDLVKNHQDVVDMADLA